MKRKIFLICGIAAALLVAGFTAYATGNNPADISKPDCGQLQSKSCCIAGATRKPDVSGGVKTPAVTTTPSAVSTPAPDTVVIEDGVQVIRSILAPRSYPDLSVQAGLPVRWIITADESSLNGCNNAISIPSLDIYQRLSVGENIIEFVPEKSGMIPYSCWMGMINATITVTETAP